MSGALESEVVRAQPSKIKCRNLIDEQSNSVTIDKINMYSKLTVSTTICELYYAIKSVILTVS
jgi:hypothetical protein